MPSVAANKTFPVRCLSPESSAVVKTLLYFGIFHYPLTSEEIHLFCQEHKLSDKESAEVLANLTREGLVNRQENFYFINGAEKNINRRLAGNKLAEKYMKKARRYSKLISCFPFVEAVFISGSLAKGFADKNSDIDYFIIAQPGRLWICRSLLIAFKKILLLNSHKYFCVNYFIDSKSLELPDKNIFTATELVFAKPMYNKELCTAFFKSNNWKQTFYPNKPPPELKSVLNPNTSAIKKAGEFIFRGNLGDRMDSWCFNLTLKHWKRKFSNFDENEFDLNLRSRKNVSKHHPNGFQFRILDSHCKAIQAYETEFNVLLS